MSSRPPTGFRPLSVISTSRDGSLYCPEDRGCGHVPNALRANRAYATRLGQRHLPGSAKLCVHQSLKQITLNNTGEQVSNLCAQSLTGYLSVTPETTECVHHQRRPMCKPQPHRRVPSARCARNQRHIHAPRPTPLPRSQSCLRAFPRVETAQAGMHRATCPTHACLGGLDAKQPRGAYSQFDARC